MMNYFTSQRKAVVVAALVAAVWGGGARAAEPTEGKLVGVVVKIAMESKEAKSAVVTLKDNKTGELVEILVTDQLTLDKFRVRKIVVDDEIRCKYEIVDGKKHSKFFRKTAGC